MTDEFRITGPGEYRTRNGQKVVVTAVRSDIKTQFPVIGFIAGRPGVEAWTVTGSCTRGDLYLDEDIISEWREPRSGEYWVNVYEYEDGSTYSGTSYEHEHEADAAAAAFGARRIAKTRKTWTEGEGL